MSQTIDCRQIATLLAALRHWQDSRKNKPSTVSLHLNNVASEGGNLEPLDAQEIDTLYDALSAKEFRAENYRPKVAVLHDAGELGVLCDPEVEVERIATDDVRALVDERRGELLDMLGDKFKHLSNPKEQSK